MSFEKLLQELDDLSDLQKSAPAADMGGEADADDGDAGGDEGDAEGAADDQAIADAAADGASEGDEGEGDEAPMAKSFRFTTEDGEEVEGIDGTELVKSLVDRLDAQETSLGKVLGSVVDLIKSQEATIRSQGELLKSLRGDIKRLGGEGRGRKAVVSVAEKPDATTLAKSQSGDQPEGVTGQEFMAKAMNAFGDGKISGLEVSLAEAALNKGMPVRADIVRRVLG